MCAGSSLKHFVDQWSFAMLRLAVRHELCGRLTSSAHWDRVAVAVWNWPGAGALPVDLIATMPTSSRYLTDCYRAGRSKGSYDRVQSVAEVPNWRGEHIADGDNKPLACFMFKLASTQATTGRLKLPARLEWTPRRISTHPFQAWLATLSS
jgi:hypothetical protein